MAFSFLPDEVIYTFGLDEVHIEGDMDKLDETDAFQVRFSPGGSMDSLKIHFTGTFDECKEWVKMWSFEFWYLKEMQHAQTEVAESAGLQPAIPFATTGC